MSSITIPNSVVSIGSGAFQGCSGLTTITIPNSVVSIGSGAFSGCSGLTTINIPNSVMNIGSGAFDDTPWYDNQPEGLVYAGKVAYKYKGTMPDNTSIELLYGTIGVAQLCFADCFTLVSITIPESVKCIYDNSFYRCYSLKSVTLNSKYIVSDSNGILSSSSAPSYLYSYSLFGTQVKDLSIGGNVTKISKSAFSHIDSLATVNIYADIDTIGENAFYDCPKITSISLPNSLKYIGSYAFSGTGLTSVVIPENVVYIGGSSFGSCDSLKAITLKSSSIANTECGIKYALEGGNNLNTLILADNITRIGNQAFCSLVNLEQILLSENIDTIGNNAFSECVSLSSITLPSSVTYIGGRAFEGCTGLSSITIPSSVTNIGYEAFSNCDSLTNVTINSNSFISKDFLTNYLNDQSCLKYIFGTQVKEYTIGGNVEKIGDYAFYECDSLTTVKITSDLDSIGITVFYNCAKLEDINIPDNVKYIGSNAFYGCTSLPVENNIRYAGTWAIGVTDQTLPRYILRSNTRGLLGTFSGCSLMTRVTLPDSLRNIGDNAFYGCSSIKNLTLPSRVNYIGSSAFSGCTSLASLTIPDGVTAIGSSAFYGCSALTSMIIPDKVESLGASLFYNCHNLSSVTLPKGLTTIENSTFHGCNLSDFEMPESVTSIGSYAFYDNPLSAIVIPSTVTSIGDYAFSNCYNLDTVTVNSADIMANGKFSKVFGENITNYNIGGNIKELADFAFFNYKKIKKITLPESLETIGESAFESCVNLDSVTLPKNVANIGAYAFASCTALKSVVSNNPVPPVCGEEAFYEVETANCSLEVPDSVVSLYSETSPWSDFNIVGVVIPTAMALVDGEAYDNKKELAMDSITYTRTFNNTNWQALYVPFAMNYEDWSADFDVAKINDIHQFDINGDGDFSDEGVDKTIMEMLIVNSGSLKPNHPYLIRAKAKGQKTITVKNAVLMPAQSKSIDCSSVEQKYVFTGTYNVIDGETMVAGKYYAMSGGSVKYTSSTANSLKPFRWYMQIQNRDGQVIQDVSEVKVAVRGEDDWDATGIDEIDTEENIYTIYSVDGRAIRSIKATTIEEATQGIASGMYIINGKKHFVK